MAVRTLPQYRPVRAFDHPLTNQSPVEVSSIYRAHVLPQEGRRTERTVFIEAVSEHSATERIVHAIAAIDQCSVQDVADRVYNLTSGRACIEEGMSEDRELRLFETGWAANGPISFVEDPLFLVSQPAALIRAWGRIRRPHSAP